jgi:hypothetical protein
LINLGDPCKRAFRLDNFISVHIYLAADEGKCMSHFQIIN